MHRGAFAAGAGSNHYDIEMLVVHAADCSKCRPLADVLRYSIQRLVIVGLMEECKFANPVDLSQRALQRG
jgi:hypothetical protein